MAETVHINSKKILSTLRYINDYLQQNNRVIFFEQGNTRQQQGNTFWGFVALNKKIPSAVFKILLPYVALNKKFRRLFSSQRN